MDLREYVFRLRMTDAEMAEMIGVSRSGYGKWKRGQRHPTPRFMVRIRDVTHGVVGPDDFLPPPKKRVAAE
jgi:transcriptional regulator with XRE-family HTH domain